MQLSSMWTVLCTVLSISQVSLPFAAAEPIPADVRVHALRARQREAGAVEIIAKRALTDDLFGDNGSGPRYWAWAKLAYDGNYNDQPGKALTGGANEKWAKLDGSDIFVKGVAGPAINAGLTPWETFTGMKAIVGKDNTNKAIVMAFIGSNDIPTFKQDLKYPLVSDSSGAIAGLTEKGFKECYDAVYQQVFEWAKAYADENTDWDIVITGHSLGGATAHIAAVAWAATNPDLASRTTVFTYGAPRAGNLEFQQKLASNQGGRMANFRHKRDVVPLVPPIHAVTDTYANPGNRYTFSPTGDGSSWSDPALWSFDANADENRAGITTGVVNAVADAFHKFDQHTGYFSTSNGRRSVRPGYGSPLEAAPIQKREAPSADDLRYAEGNVGEMRQSNELKGQLQLTPKLEEFTQHLKITSEQEDLIRELNNLQSEDERVNFLKWTEIFAMEQ